MKDLKFIAEQLDTAFELPNGWKFGWDGILGFFPGFGNVISDAFSLYIIFRAAVMGCTPAVLLHMIFNVLIDNIVDKVPVLGFFFDFMWKSNTKNIELLEKFLEEPEVSRKQSKFFLIAVAVLLFLFFIGTIVSTFFLFKWFLSLVFSEAPIVPGW